ncbi:hypothetical protein BSM4216_3639 [Bacillus smithii]|nr:hypothetical protein BSM4216_3639 [Bacillus smithii]
MEECRLLKRGARNESEASIPMEVANRKDSQTHRSKRWVCCILMKKRKTLSTTS